MGAIHFGGGTSVSMELMLLVEAGDREGLHDVAVSMGRGGSERDPHDFDFFLRRGLAVEAGFHGGDREGVLMTLCG